MEEIKNSSVLDKLMEHAKTIGSRPVTAASAERFIVAVCDLVDGSFSVDEPSDNSKENLNQLLTKIGVDIEKLKNNLLIHINGENASLSFMDGLYMQKKAFEAKSKAQKKNISSLTPELLLECVLSDPTDAIKNSIKGESVPSGEITDDRSEAIRHILEDKFDELFEGGTSKAPQKEEKIPESTTKTEDNSNPKKIVAELTEKVKCTREELLSVIYGQDNAVSVFTTGYFQAELLTLTDKKRVRPRATFLFAGPPGVGKTFLAEKAAEILKMPFMRFDMSEYSDHEANIEFCGSDKVYKNGKAGNVTGFVEAHPKCVLLFDEIEKAHISVIHLFLQMLDAGRLRDNFTDTEVSFTNAIIIFTTNAGKQLYEQSESGDFSGLSRKVILKALQKDINPETGAPFFPAAICSRFASGNVVMFNHIGAHNLREIAKREVLRHAENFEKEIGISVDIDEMVYTAILFAEGGAADARTIRSRSETFFDDELFELFRLVASDKSANDIEDIENIKISVQLPTDDKQIVSLFDAKDSTDVLVFSSKQTAEMCSTSAKDCHILSAQTIDAATKILHNNDVQVAIIDINHGQNKSACKYLNAEDIESVSRDFFWYIRENYRDLPVYLLQTPGTVLNEEEKISFMRLGVRGVIELVDDGDAFGEKLSFICNTIHQQNSMAYLAKSNKIISFETAQSVSKKGKIAEIKLFDFEMSTAVDAEDSKNILSNVSKPNVRFDQVIGAEDAKKELRYFVEYLKNPKKYLGTGVRAPKGVILYGPPGTGKTMLAKAMACESDVTFITAEGNQFLKKYIGEGKDKVHELFQTARKYAPSILFVDEIDAIAKERKGGDNAGANGEDVLTAFLTEMDGFKNDPTKPVFVLAATNFDVEPGHEKSLDPALMRRFDRKVYIDLPNREERTRYINLKIESNEAFAVSDSEIENIAIRSTGMSLAELESVVELALRSAIRDGGCKVTDAVLEEAFETYNSGEEKKWDTALLERVARHEAGHAFLCWQSGETPSYLTIVARGNHGGYMQHDDNEGKAIYTKDELLAKIRTSLGGRASEIVYYGEKDGISTGASGDLASATSLAQQIICTYGMDDDFGLAVIDGQSARMSELSSEVRAAVNKILDDQMKQAIRVITEGKDAIDALVSELMSKNHMTGIELNALLENHIDREMYNVKH